MALVLSGSTGIVEANIADSAITTNKIASDSITSAKISNGAVAASDLASTLDLTGKTVTLPSTSGGMHKVYEYTPTTNVSYIDTGAIFTSAFRNYRVVVSMLEVITNGYVRMRLSNNGTENSDTVYWCKSVGGDQGDGVFYGYGYFGTTASNYWQFNTAYQTGAGLGISASIDIYAPQSGQYKAITGLVSQVNTSNSQFSGHTLWGFYKASTSNNGIRIFTDQNGFYGTGRVTVYGYN